MFQKLLEGKQIWKKKQPLMSMFSELKSPVFYNVTPKHAGKGNVISYYIQIAFSGLKFEWWN